MIAVGRLREAGASAVLRAPPEKEEFQKAIQKCLPVRSK